MSSVAEIDAELDKEYPDIANLQNTNVAVGDDEEDQKETIEVEDKSEEDANSNDEKDADVESDEEKDAEANTTDVKLGNDKLENVSTEKSTEKDSHAFATLRSEKAELAKKLKESEELEKDMAIISGYSDVESFRKAVQSARIKKEAEAGGYTIQQYEDIQNIKKDAETIREEKNALIAERNFNNLNNSINKVFEENNIPSTDRDDLIKRLESAGFKTLEELYAIPNIEVVIKGIMVDKIINSAKQSQIEAETKLDNIADKSHISTVSDGLLSIDQLLDEEEKEFRTKRGY